MEKHLIKQIVQKGISKPAALCSLVQWKGSVPRKDYPWMIVDKNKSIIGTIGGGRMEYLTIRAAFECLRKNLIQLHEFDMSSTDPLGQSSVCGGKTLVLIEPILDTNEITFIAIQNAIDNKINAVLITQLDGNTKITVKRKLISEKTGFYEYPKIVAEKAVKLLKNGGSVTVTRGNELFLIQPIKPDPILHIFGAGHVGRSVAKLAHFLELQVNIYDNRKEIATKERFPDANKIFSDDYGLNELEKEIHKNDFLFIATHGHQNDLHLLKSLINYKVAYIGLMCSKNKWRVLSRALLDEGINANQINKIFAPVGISIGSETVPEIAVSILAEIINHYRHGNSGSMSLTQNI
ncbi:XdhC family protein [Candidatus Neomarinimicrobiota bacterium]